MNIRRGHLMTSTRLALLATASLTWALTVAGAPPASAEAPAPERSFITTWSENSWGSHYCNVEGTVMIRYSDVMDPNTGSTTSTPTSAYIHGHVHIYSHNITGFHCAVTFVLEPQSIPQEMQQTWSIGVSAYDDKWVDVYQEIPLSVAQADFANKGGKITAVVT